MADAQFPRDPKIIPNHESAVRKLVSEAHGLAYEPLQNLNEARSYLDGIAILQGDDGGQIYIVCPVALIKCSESTLQQLLTDLDALAWPGNDPDSAKIYYERKSSDTNVIGGMGGAKVIENIWIHQEFKTKGLESAIKEVIEGKISSIK